jgi:hypothetical protein
MGRKVDFHGDDWLPEDDEDAEGSFSDDYDWRFSADYERDLDAYFDDFGVKNR